MHSLPVNDEPILQHKHFPGLLPDEEIKLVLRKHLITLVPMVFTVILIACTPLFGIYLFSSLLDYQSKTVALALVAGLSSFYLLLLLTSFVFLINHRYDIGVVTNLRILDINQSAVFFSTFSEVPLSEIKDVKGEIIGIMGNIFHFGRITIQITGSKHRFIFNHMPDVYIRVREITQLHMEQLGALYQTKSATTSLSSATSGDWKELLDQAIVAYLASPEGGASQGQNPFCTVTHKYGICAHEMPCPFHLENHSPQQHTFHSDLHTTLQKLTHYAPMFTRSR